VANVRKAGWLPGLREHEIDEWRTLSFPGTDIVVPCLGTDGLRAQADRLKKAQADYLASLSVARIVALLDRVATRWLEPGSPYRREAERLLPLVTGYAEPAIRKGLASWLATLREQNVLRLLHSELSDPSVLDGFAPRGEAGGETRAFGPCLTVHVWSGNVPGLPAQSLVSALLVKSASLGKVASEEPLFATLLAESIAEVDPRLAECLAVTYWPGGDEKIETAAFGQADAVIAYGTERAIESIRRRVPSSARFMGYGHKLSFGAIAREALAPEQRADTVDRATYDVAKYDQQGCLSPHVFYVEDGGACSPRDFASALSTRLGEYDAIVSRGRLTLEEAASQTALRDRFEMRELAGESVAVFTNAGGAVLFDAEPNFEASCLNRTIYVKPVSDLLKDLPSLVQPVRRYLQTCGVAAGSERRRELAEALGRLGVDRVCPLGRMGDVAPTWHHDGRFNLLELLRWTDIEPDSSAGRWEFAHPDLGLYGEGVIADERRNA
jgi:acyl-CoA reductase LuxC